MFKYLFLGVHQLFFRLLIQRTRNSLLSAIHSWNIRENNELMFSVKLDQNDCMMFGSRSEQMEFLKRPSALSKNFRSRVYEILLFTNRCIRNIIRVSSVYECDEEKTQRSMIELQKESKETNVWRKVRPFVHYIGISGSVRAVTQTAL